MEEIHGRHEWALRGLANPGIVSVPLGFRGCRLGTTLSREGRAERTFHELFVRSETGIGAERPVVH